MKVLIYLLPFIASAQLHLGVGLVDISNRNDGNTLTWHVGYRQDIGSLGVDFNYRYTGVLGENFRSWEFRTTYRLVDADYRLEMGPGMAFNQEDKDTYPVIHLRNSIKIADHAHVIVDFDNSFRSGRRKRNEMYLSLGIALDYDFIRDVIIGKNY